VILRISTVEAGTFKRIKAICYTCPILFYPVPYSSLTGVKIPGQDPSHTEFLLRFPA